MILKGELRNGGRLDSKHASTAHCSVTLSFFILKVLSLEQVYGSLRAVCTCENKVRNCGPLGFISGFLGFHWPLA